MARSFGYKGKRYVEVHEAVYVLQEHKKSFCGQADKGWADGMDYAIQILSAMRTCRDVLAMQTALASINKAYEAMKEEMR